MSQTYSDSLLVQWFVELASIFDRPGRVIHRTLFGLASQEDSLAIEDRMMEMTSSASPRPRADPSAKSLFVQALFGQPSWHNILAKQTISTPLQARPASP
jgi:hypothetical protein